MHRRNLLKASMAIAAYTGLSATGLLAARAWAGNGAADGDAQAFDFEALKIQAKQLASNRQTIDKQLANNRQTIEKTRFILCFRPFSSPRKFSVRGKAALVLSP